MILTHAYGPGRRRSAGSSKRRTPPLAGPAGGGARSAWARLRARSAHEGTQVHPADLDDALCAAALAGPAGGAGGEARLPFAVAGALLQGAAGGLGAARGAPSTFQGSAETARRSFCSKVAIIAEAVRKSER